MLPDLPPPASLVSSILERIRRRLLIRMLLQCTIRALAVSVIAGSAALLVSNAVVMASFVPASTLIVVAAMVALRGLPTRREAAQAIERAYPSCRNVVITAEELLRHSDRGAVWIRERVFQDAARQLASVRGSDVAPVRNDAVVTVSAIGGLAFLTASLPDLMPASLTRGAAVTHPAESRGPLSMRIHLYPPGYTARQPFSLENPERLDVLEGTVARFSFPAAADAVRLRSSDRHIALRVEEGLTVGEARLDQSGYFVVERENREILIPVIVSPDRAPSVRVESPARDVILPEAGGAVQVEAAAADDLGLATMSLRYTKVSGSGEQYEFAEGELPIHVTRESPLAWRARGQISLEALGLQPGDSLVYRVTAQDHRKAAGVGSSETFFIEVAGPGQVALDGFDMPPDQDRFALSQQMIVIKIERLRRVERALARDEFMEQLAAIAAEQRSVRANFVFLMGGHVEDEEAEAGQEHEIQEGRLENTSRREMSRAVGHMSSTEQSLIAANTDVALKQAKLAVEALQRAFGRNRYILRTLGVRSRIDSSRRLTGSLDGARDAERDEVSHRENRQALAARRLLIDMLAFADAVRDGKPAAGSVEQLTRAAEQALAVDPADGEWRQIADSLMRFRATAQGRVNAIDDLRAIIRALGERVRRDSLAGSSPVTRSSALRSAWTEERSRQ